MLDLKIDICDICKSRKKCFYKIINDRDCKIVNCECFQFDKVFLNKLVNDLINDFQSEKTEKNLKKLFGDIIINVAKLFGFIEVNDNEK